MDDFNNTYLPSRGLVLIVLSLLNRLWGFRSSSLFPEDRISCASKEGDNLGDDGRAATTSEILSNWLCVSWPGCEPHPKTLITFHYTGWFIGILLMAYDNPYIIGWYNPLYTLNQEDFFRGSCGVTNLQFHTHTISPMPQESFHLNKTHPTFNSGFGGDLFQGWLRC